MDSSRFDRISRQLAAATSRRSIVQAVTAGVLGGVAALAPGRASARSQKVVASRLADADLDEQAVILYEALATLADNHTGNCDELAAVTMQLLETNADVYQSVREEQDSWSHTQRFAHAQKYGDRLDTATQTLHFARQRCTYRAGSSGATSNAIHEDFQAFTSRPRALQDTCDCGSDCPISTGWCIYAWAACVTGSPCECCWSSYCGSTDHCMTDCQANECCTGEQTCATPDPPDGG